MAGKQLYRILAFTAYTLAIIFSFSIAALSDSKDANAGPTRKNTAPLRYAPECSLQAVLKYKNVTPRADIPIPIIYLGSETTLRQMTDALYPHQWTSPPAEFSNAFAYKNGRNEIYLLDDPKYNAKHGRFTDDSLAHELIHFVQIRYQNADLTQDDFAEFDAISFQNWFRDTYMIPQGLPANAPCL